MVGGPMMVWALGRGVRATITMVIVSFIMFMLLFVGPNPLEMLKERPDYRPADIERLVKQYGWDKPWHEQYLSWAGNFVTGDWGTSIRSKQPARDLIMDRLPLTLLLTGSAQLLSLVIAIPLGMYLAQRRGSKVDNAAAVVSFGLMAAPGFFLALLLQVIALKLYHVTGIRVVSTAGAPVEGGVLDYVQHLALPVLALSLVQIAGWSRYQRGELLGVLDQDYIRSAAAKGLSPSTVVRRHALKNTLLPVVTIVALDVALLFAGAVFVETVFALPGMGGLLLESVLNRDVVVALDIVTIGCALMVLANTAADLLYGVVDPRARSSS